MRLRIIASFVLPVALAAAAACSSDGSSAPCEGFYALIRVPVHGESGTDPIQYDSDGGVLCDAYCPAHTGGCTLDGGIGPWADAGDLSCFTTLGCGP